MVITLPTKEESTTTRLLAERKKPLRSPELNRARKSQIYKSVCIYGKRKCLNAKPLPFLPEKGCKEFSFSCWLLWLPGRYQSFSIVKVVTHTRPGHTHLLIFRHTFNPFLFTVCRAHRQSLCSN